MTTATVTTTAQNNKFSEQKQSLSTCVLNFGTFFFWYEVIFSSDVSVAVAVVVA